MSTEAEERVAKAIDAAQLKWKAENGGDKASCNDCPPEFIARAAIAAVRAYDAETLGKDGEVENG